MPYFKKNNDLTATHKVTFSFLRQIHQMGKIYSIWADFAKGLKYCKLQAENLLLKYYPS